MKKVQYQPRFFVAQESEKKGEDEHPVYIYNNTYWNRPKVTGDQEIYDGIFL